MLGNYMSEIKSLKTFSSDEMSLPPPSPSSPLSPQCLKRYFPRTPVIEKISTETRDETSVLEGGCGNQLEKGEVGCNNFCCSENIECSTEISYIKEFIRAQINLYSLNSSLSRVRLVDTIKECLNDFYPETSSCCNESKPLVLSKDDYYTSVKLRPIVSVDFIVRDDRDILVGRRINSPAKDTFFTPGGVVYKNESINQAISRISETEFGIKLTKDEVNFFGVYEHNYKDNFRDNNFGTHYVVLTFIFDIKSPLNKINIDMKDQHTAIKWLTPEQLLNHKEVHENVKVYARELSKELNE